MPWRIVEAGRGPGSLPGRAIPIPRRSSRPSRCRITRRRSQRILLTGDVPSPSRRRRLSFSISVAPMPRDLCRGTLASSGAVWRQGPSGGPATSPPAAVEAVPLGKAV